MSDNIQILIVDDNQINRQYFSMALKKFGYQVTVAENGFKAIEYAKKKPYDLIYMDIRMPEMDGYETTSKIRSIKLHTSTPILAISAEIISKQKSQIFDGFILKPASPQTLKENVEKFCFKTEKAMAIFNKQKALKYAYNDEDIMHKLIDMFLNELPVQIKLLEQSINTSNSSEIQNTIHKFRGSCQTCGAVALDKNLQELSVLLKENMYSEAALKKTRNSVNDFIKEFS